MCQERRRGNIRHEGIQPRRRAASARLAGRVHEKDAHGARRKVAGQHAAARVEVQERQGGVAHAAADLHSPGGAGRG